MNQERKAQLAPGIKEVLKKYGLKGSLKVEHHATLCLTLQSGSIDFGDTTQVNTYHIDSHFEGVQKQALTELRDAMSVGNHDRSDVMTDYFDVGWYVDISIGQWNKKYIFTA